MGHLAKNCWEKTPGTANTPATNTGAAKTCYECGQKGHCRNECPNKKGPEKGRGRAFNINAHQAHMDPDLVNDTFLLNNHIISVLSECGANRGFVSIESCCMLDKTHVPTDTKHFIELVNDKLMKADKIINTSRSHVLQEKTRIPLDSGENLTVFGDKNIVKLNLISCIMAQKYLRKGYHAILAHVKKIETKEQQIEDVPSVREFPNVFPKELHGLPPHRSVEFQIDLVPGATPVTRSP
ncbi:uncharacterized protein [Rutidosis leptorrhynchoides]|uniref:uncharacterized protein n=1 Tax=Rutidosis leptorrhynchoides TaxID=125765 RepID=UPI003A98E800